MVELLAEMLSNYAKVHAFEMGLLLGLFVTFAYRDHEGVAYGLLFFGVFFAFFNAAHIGWEEINSYPLYFLSGVYFTTVLGMIRVPLVDRIRDRLVREKSLDEVSVRRVIEAGTSLGDHDTPPSTK